MRRVYLLAALAFGAVLLGLLTLDGSLLIFSVPLIVFIASSLLFSPTRPQLEIARKLDIERVSPGGTVTAQITVTNHGGAIEAMQLTNLFPDGLQLTGGMANIAAWLRRGESKTFTQVFSGQRGQYIFDEIAVHAGDHFDLFSHRLSQAAGGRLVVVPRAERLKAIKIRPRRTRVYAGLIPTRSSGPGIDYYGIRQYVAGDPLRWVDWKTSARHQDKFFTKLFEQERAADVGLILDARRSSSTHAGESSIFEHSIQAAAALSETLLAAGNRVGLLVYGDLLDWTFPAYGKIQHERILQRLAQARQGDSPAFNKLDNLPTRLFHPQSQLIFISSLIEKDIENLYHLRARGYQVLVVSPNPVSFAAPRLAPSDFDDLAIRAAHLERILMLRKVRRGGIQVLDWHVHIPFKQSAHASLSRNPLWMRSIGLDA